MGLSLLSELNAREREKDACQYDVICIVGKKMMQPIGCLECSRTKNRAQKTFPFVRNIWRIETCNQSIMLTSTDNRQTILLYCR